MKTLSSIILKATVLSTFVAFLLISCSEDESATKPRVATVNASDITFNSVTLGGTITSNGGSTILAKGICYSTTPAPMIDGDTTNQGEGDGDFVTLLSNLSTNTTYYARAYATNAVGTSYGEEFSFITQTGLADVTLNLSDISYKKINASLTITSSGASSVNNSGFVYSTENHVPTIMDYMWPSVSSELTIEHMLSELNVGTIYYIRAFAQNSQGISYSNVQEVSTLSLPEVTDIDGNTYTSVILGDKVWMAQNLKVTKFSNGDAIPTTATLNQSIVGVINPIYQWAPGGDDANINMYGRLYTSAVATDNRNVCPTGWHVTTYAEYQDLQTLTGNNGNKLKTQGTDNWQHANGTNEFEFNAVGAGVRYEDGSFPFFKYYGEIWTQDSYNATEQKSMMLYSQFSYFDYANRPKNDGHSIRCVKD